MYIAKPACHINLQNILQHVVKNSFLLVYHMIHALLKNALPFLSNFDASLQLHNQSGHHHANHYATCIQLQRLGKYVRIFAKKTHRLFQSNFAAMYT